VLTTLYDDTCPACGGPLEIGPDGLPGCRGDCPEEYAARLAEDAEDRAALEAAGCVCCGCGRADGPALDADPALLRAAERLRIYGCCCA